MLRKIHHHHYRCPLSEVKLYLMEIMESDTVKGFQQNMLCAVLVVQHQKDFADRCVFLLLETETSDLSFNNNFNVNFRHGVHPN